MEKEEFEKSYKQAEKLNINENYLEALEILKTLNNYAWATTDIKFQFLIAGTLRELNKHKEALHYFKKAKEIDEKSEIASLGIYLSWIKIERSDKAIEEIKSYLGKYPANLYKTTLEELLGDINNGYATDFKETILYLAKKNHIHHPQ